MAKARYGKRLSVTTAANNGTLSRRQYGSMAKGVTRKQAANLARSKGFGGKGG